MDHQMFAATQAAMQSRQVANSALVNLRDDSCRLRLVHDRMRAIDLQLREDLIKEFKRCSLATESLNNLCTAVDDLDAIARDIKLELKHQRCAVSDINHAAVSTLGTLMTVKQRMLRAQVGS